MRVSEDIEEAIDTYGDTVWRVCVLYFKQGADAQDAFQETVIKYASYDAPFNDSEHKKAWLIRVATNVCKDMLKASHRFNLSIDEEVVSYAIPSTDSSTQPGSAKSEIVEAMQALTDPPRTPVYLSLYEGYTAPEIADMLEAPVNTVYSWISRGKQQLKEALA